MQLMPVVSFLLCVAACEERACVLCIYFLPTETTTRSSLNILFLRGKILKSYSLFSEARFSSSLIIFVALLWTCVVCVLFLNCEPGLDIVLQLLCNERKRQVYQSAY